MKSADHFFALVIKDFTTQCVALFLRRDQTLDRCGAEAADEIGFNLLKLGRCDLRVGGEIEEIDICGAELAGGEDLVKKFAGGAGKGVAKAVGVGIGIGGGA